MSGDIMASEMAQQPDVLRRLADRRSELVSSLRSVLPAGLNGTTLIARGSSDHAAVFGRYALELASRRPVALAAPSLHTLYDSRTELDGYLAVAVSQSGRTPEIVTVFERAMARGARGVAMTNEADSPLATKAEMTIDLGAGSEQAVPATKTFTAQLVGFAILAEALGEVPWPAGDWERLPGAVQEVVDDPGPAETVAKSLLNTEGLVCVGRGFAYSVALEAALKLKETTGLLAEGYSAADLRHGPIAIVHQNFPVLAFALGGRAQPDMDDLVTRLHGRGAQVFRVAPDAEAELPIPEGLSEALSLIPAAVRAQQVALELARGLGLDPDSPEGLTKMTPTT